MLGWERWPVIARGARVSVWNDQCQLWHNQTSLTGRLSFGSIPSFKKIYISLKKTMILGCWVSQQDVVSKICRAHRSFGPRLRSDIARELHLDTAQNQWMEPMVGTQFLRKATRTAPQMDPNGVLSCAFRTMGICHDHPLLGWSWTSAGRWCVLCSEAGVRTAVNQRLGIAKNSSEYCYGSVNQTSWYQLVHTRSLY